MSARFILTFVNWLMPHYGKWVSQKFKSNEISVDEYEKIKIEISEHKYFYGVLMVLEIFTLFVFWIGFMVLYLQIVIVPAGEIFDVATNHSLNWIVFAVFMGMLLGSLPTLLAPAVYFNFYGFIFPLFKLYRWRKNKNVILLNSSVMNGHFRMSGNKMAGKIIEANKFLALVCFIALGICTLGYSLFRLAFLVGFLPF